eukprot:6266150-Amphidinium_carterae.1
MAVHHTACVSRAYRLWRIQRIRRWHSQWCPRCSHCIPNAMLVYDKACMMIQTAATGDPEGKIKHWCVDRFHAHVPSRKCPCSPLHLSRRNRHLRGVNTSAARVQF